MTPIERQELLRDLPMAEGAIEGREALVERLEAACRVLRQRGLAGHWTYDLTHHRSLLRHLDRLKGETLA